MKIEKAGLNDIDEILALVRECARDMNAQGLYQWSEKYPPRDIFEFDLKAGTLFSIKEDGKIIGIIVLAEYQDDEYEEVEWTDKSGRFLVAHRLAVHPKWQRKGIATKLMDFAEIFAKDEGHTSIRVDTYSDNPRSMGLFEKRKYDKKPGHIHFPEVEGPFYCYEKIIHI